MKQNDYDKKHKEIMESIGVRKKQRWVHDDDVKALDKFCEDSKRRAIKRAKRREKALNEQAK